MESKSAVRIVSLCPSTTESLIDLGLADQLVGITRFCIHPREVVQNLPRVGGTKDPKREKIEAARPDLVFMNEEENRREDYAWIAPRCEVDVSYPQGPADVPDLLRRWGDRLGVRETAEGWATAIEGELAAPATGFGSFAYLIWRRPFMAAGEDTYIHRLLEGAGGRNVVRGMGRYPEIERDDLAELAPDWLLLPDEPFPFDERHVPELVETLPPRTRVLLVGGDDLSWHGTRTLRGLRLARALFAGACSPGPTRWTADTVRGRSAPTP